MLICLDLHAQGFIPCFPMFYPFFVSRLMIRVIFSHARMALLAMICSDPCVYVLFAMFYAQICIRTCLYAWIHILPCLCTKFLYVYVHVSMPICLDLCSHMPMCLDLRSLHAFFYIPCACALHAMFRSLDLGYVYHAMCYCSLFVALSFFLVFWPIGLDLIQTLWSLSSAMPLGSYQRVWIILICMSMLACLLLCFMLALASLVLGFVTPDALSRHVVVWLHPTPMRPYLDVTTWDVLPRCRSLCAYLSPFPLHVMMGLPSLFMPLVGFLFIFTHLLTCPCMSLACQCVIHASTQ